VPYNDVACPVADSTAV